jgi:hypothetical protein
MPSSTGENPEPEQSKARPLEERRARPPGERQAGDAESESRGGVSPPRAPRTVREPLDSYGSQCSALAMQKRPVGKQTRR